jgi:hypothetical protein
MILEILGSAGFGSLLGGVFGYLGKREERHNLEMRFKHEETMVAVKTDSAIKLADTQGKWEVEKTDASAFQEGQKTKSSAGDFLKAIVRPLILACLMWQSYLIYMSLEKMTGGLGSLPPEAVLDLYRLLVLSVIGLTGTAIGWYFSVRTSKQFDKLLDKWG